MRRAPVWLMLLALVAFGLGIRPEPNRPAAAPVPATPNEECATSSCRQIAHDLSSVPPEQLPLPTPDPKPATKGQQSVSITEAVSAPSKEVRPASLMVGPDGVIYRRTSSGNSADRR
jgi:hypothetical protein